MVFGLKKRTHKASVNTSFLHKLIRVGLLASVLGTTVAVADTWPTQPIKIVVPFAAGGSTDSMARLIANRLSPMLGQPVIIENKPGASGVIAANSVLRSPADGNTLLVAISSMMSVLPAYMKEPPFDALKEFAPITQISSMPMILLVNGDSPLNSVADLIAQSKKKPLNFASVGAGTMHHLTSELLRLQTGANLVHVPYKGATPGMADLMGGHVDMFMIDYTSAAGLLSSGKVKALAVTGKERHPMLKDVPTMIELGIPLESLAWTAVFAPSKTPKAIVERLNHDIDQIVKSADFREELLRMGGIAVGGSTEQLGNTVQADFNKWAKIIDDAKIERQ